MFPLLLSPLLGGLGSLIKTGTGLAGAGVKSAFKAMSATKQAADDAQEIAAQATAAEESGGGGDKDEGGGKDEKKIKKSMFGGLDLANIKSQIDGPMGPPEPVEEVKGGVYKQIFAVNKSMLASLLGMEKSLKMLLSIEYERIQGMMSDDTDDRSDDLKKGETDPKEGEKKKGLLGRAASGVGGMLGSAYSKAKGGLSGNFGKLLGIGALIIAFKKYPDQIKAAFKKILTFFKSVYDYFSADDFTFAQFKSDLAAKFLPAVRDFLMSGLDFLWGAIKGVAVDWIYGAQGDNRIRQESGTAMTAMGVLGDTTTKVGAALANVKDKDISTRDTAAYFANQGIDYDDYKIIQKQVKDTWAAMYEIYDQSDGRIQWSGIGSMKGLGTASYTKFPIADIMNTTPIIDGVTYPSWDVLKDIQLMKMGGITKGMTEDKQNEIKESLAEKTALAVEYETIKNKPLSDSALAKATGVGINDEAERTKMLTAIEDKIAKKDEDIKYLGQIFAPVDTESTTGTTTESIIGTTGVSANTGSLATQAQKDAKKVRDDAKLAKLNAEKFAFLSMNQPGRNITTSTNIDQSSNSIINSSMGGFPTSDTARAFQMKKLENTR